MNTASKILLETVIRSASETKEETTSIVDLIFDWRDADSNARPNGVEFSSYKSGDTSASIKNGKFEYIEELGHIAGINQNIFHKIKPDVTVLILKRGVDPRFASTNLMNIILSYNNIIARQFEESRETNSDRASIALLKQSGISKHMFSSSTRSSYSISAAAMSKSGACRARDILVTITKSSYSIHTW
ncbi:MAG: hypothetical protein COB93_11010 [Sneathiella sp.]|nr:MAG: hypothetical protein COB93_11010 [Sneathiella sp.]